MCILLKSSIKYSLLLIFYSLDVVCCELYSSDQFCCSVLQCSLRFKKIFYEREHTSSAARAHVCGR